MMLAGLLVPDEAVEDLAEEFACGWTRFIA
jgi:hypothetical protein